MTVAAWVLLIFMSDSRAPMVPVYFATEQACWAAAKEAKRHLPAFLNHQQSMLLCMPTGATP